MTAADGGPLYDEDSLGPQELMGALFSPDGIADPHRFIAKHRGVRTSWQAVDTLLRSPNTGRAPVPGDSVLWELFNRWPVQLDGEVHQAFRRVARDPFRRDAIDDYLGAVEQTAHALLDELAPRGDMEAMADLFAPLSFVAIWRILALPPEDLDEAHRLMVRLAQSFAHQQNSEALAAYEPDIQQAWDYFADVVQQRRDDPGNDLISTLAVDGRDEGIDDDTLAACALFLVHTHHEEICNGLGNALVTLLQHPDQLKALVADRSLMDTAVDELLRFEPVIQPVTLMVNDDVEADRWTVPAGTHMTVLLAGANRDPDVFDDPHTLDLTRQPNPHLSFAPGQHYCLGRHLATAELKLVLDMVLDRLPGIELAGEPQWRAAYPIRQLDQLPIRWSN